MKNLFNVIAACALVFALVSCGGGGSSSSSSGTTITPPAGLMICLPADPKGAVSCPTSESVVIGSSQQFNATFQSAPATVTWSINGVVGGNATVGTITTGGLYTAPSPFPSPNTFTLTATLQSDSSKIGTIALRIVYPNNNAQSQSPPVQMGTTGGNATDVEPVTGGKVCCSGTLGALIERGTPAVFYVLSNNHVLAKSDKGTVSTASTVGDNITQPGLVDNSCNPGANVVAHLSEFTPLAPASSPGPAPKNVDAAIAQIVAGTVDTSGSILDLGAADGTSIAPAAPSTLGNAAPSVGLQVAKVGRSTGLTCASISSINTAVKVQYDGSCGGTVAFTSTFSNQIFIGDTSFSSSGDSGSLVVASASSRPVGLLFAGADGGGTFANPIADVIAAFKTAAGTPAIVGAAADHTVSCVPSASVNSATITAGASNLSATQLQRAEAIRARNAPLLMQDPAVASVEVGTSADSPGEAALVMRLNAMPGQPVPATVEGMRTRVVLPAAAARQASLSAEDIDRATAVKEFYVAHLMSERGIQGVGVSASADNPLDPAVMIFTIAGEPHPPIPATLDGIRTRVLESARIRAFGWGRETVPSTGSCSKAGSAPPKQDLVAPQHELFTARDAKGIKKHGNKK